VRVSRSLRCAQSVEARGLAAGIYTQSIDVEGEINGLITCDRKVRRLARQALAEIHQKAGLVP
jgi:beta-galactosidase